MPRRSRPWTTCQVTARLEISSRLLAVVIVLQRIDGCGHLSASVAISPRPARPQCREAGGPSALRHSPARPAWPPRARLASRGRVPRPGPARLPVRLRQGAHWADLQARLAAGTLGASRSRPVSRPATRTITRLLGARPSPQRPQRRHGRRRQRARGPVLLHAHREEDYAHQQPSLTTQKLRR